MMEYGVCNVEMSGQVSWPVYAQHLLTYIHERKGVRIALMMFSAKSRTHPATII